MTERKWTPGPWVARPMAGWGRETQVCSDHWPRPVATLTHHPDRYYRHVTIERDGEEITTFADPTPEGEARADEVDAIRTANAHLIAAAPEMFEALDRINDNARLVRDPQNPEIAVYLVRVDDINAADNALEKARGET